MLKIVRVINFREFHYPRKFFNNEIFPDYGRSRFFTFYSNDPSLWYSSNATWYLHACCSLKFLVWRLHHAFNIWTGARYICACIRQIVRRVYQLTFHLNVNCIDSIHNKLTNIVSVCSNRSLNRLSYWKLLTYSWVQYLIPYCLVCYRLVWRMDPIIIGNWISINLFAFGLSVG